MAKLNTSIINIAQTLNINSSKKLQISGRDLNFRGYNTETPEDPFELSGNAANINRALFWLASKRGDFGRRNLNKGGLLYELLGKLSPLSDLSEWERIITSEFNKEFFRDLELLDVHLMTDSSYRKLIINMTVRDILTNKIVTIAEGAEL